MSEYTITSVRTSEEQRKRWDKTVEEHTELESISQLIKLGVERVIENPTRAPSPDTNAVDLSEVLDNQQEIKNELTVIANRLDRIERERESKEVFEVEQAVFQALPEKPGPQTPTTPPSKWAATPEEIAEAIIRPIKHVEQTLERLAEKRASVESTTDDRVTYYWRKP